MRRDPTQIWLLIIGLVISVTSLTQCGTDRPPTRVAPTVEVTK